MTIAQAEALLLVIGPVFDAAAQWSATQDPARLTTLADRVATALASGAQMTSATSTSVNGFNATTFVPDQNWTVTIA